MADTVEPTETVVPEALKNEAEPTAAPIVEKPVEDSEVERLRKQLQQEQMRANQLQNKLSSVDEEKAAAAQAELEAKEEYKTLYEQERAKREEVERERQAAEQAKALTDAQSNVLADYSDEVKDTAKKLGLNLSDVSEEALNEFKGKLDTLQSQASNHRVTANNPSAITGKKEYSKEELSVILNDPTQRDAYFRDRGGLTASMMEPQR